MNGYRHILLVEDDPRDVELTIDALVASGVAVDVTVLGDGEEVLDYMRNRGKYRLRRADPPSVILLDIKMPKVNGIEVLQQLKTDERFKATPVVMITSSRQEQDFIAAYTLSADGYLTKPVTPEQLAKTIESAIHGKGK